MVARDVLALLDARRIRATHGEYFSLPMCKSIQMDSGAFETVSLKDVLEEPETPACNVCAIGASMYASTLRLNKVEAPVGILRTGLSLFFRTPSSQDSTMSNGTSANAIRVFGLPLLCRMEDAFECGHYGYGGVRKGAPRLRAIYRNIIKNKGTRLTNFNSKS